MEFLLSQTRDAEAAKRFFLKALSSTTVPAIHTHLVEEQGTSPTIVATSTTSTPRVMNVDKNAAYPKAFNTLKAEGIFRKAVN